MLLRPLTLRSHEVGLGLSTLGVHPRLLVKVSELCLPLVELVESLLPEVDVNLLLRIELATISALHDVKSSRATLLLSKSLPDHPKASLSHRLRKVGGSDVAKASFSGYSRQSGPDAF